MQRRSKMADGEFDGELSAYRWWFYAAAVYNLLWGTLNVLFPNLYFDVIGMSRPSYPALWQVVGMFVAVFAPVYWWMGRHPGRFRHFIVSAVQRPRVDARQRQQVVDAHGGGRAQQQRRALAVFRTSNQHQFGILAQDRLGREEQRPQAGGQRQGRTFESGLAGKLLDINGFGPVPAEEQVLHFGRLDSGLLNSQAQGLRWVCGAYGGEDEDVGRGGHNGFLKGRYTSSIVNLIQPVPVRVIKKCCRSRTAERMEVICRTIRSPWSMTRKSPWSRTTTRRATWWNGPNTTATCWRITKSMPPAPPVKSWKGSSVSRSRNSRAARWAVTSRSAPKLSMMRSTS